jgi:hypothetical protein
MGKSSWRDALGKLTQVFAIIDSRNSAIPTALSVRPIQTTTLAGS